LHGFEDAKMEQDQDEWRIMVQIGCRCPLDKQDAFLKPVRGFGAREVPAKWHEQLMAVGAEAERGGSSGGDRKGKGKMRASDDDGVSSSDEEAARQLEEQGQELIQRACQGSFLARRASSLDLRAAAAAPEVVAAAQPVRATAAAAASPSITATTLARLAIAAPGGRWGGGCSVWVCACGRGWRSVCG
jgi:hypothetical protein